MVDEIIYMLGIVAVGFSVNYALRALPFLLFSGKSRTLPDWVERLGVFISPVIIGGLIIYAYSGTAWRTPWPYVAGFVTVALQLLRRNALLSIIAGTAFYMLFVNCCGCASERTLQTIDAEHPEVIFAQDGLYFSGERISAADIVGRLEGADIPKTRTIHILQERGLRDLRRSRALLTLLARGGYTRAVFVTRRHSESMTLPRKGNP